MIEKEYKQLVINACKHIAKQSAEHLQTMILLQKADFSELATIKGLLDAVQIMVSELPEKEQEQTEREKEPVSLVFDRGKLNETVSEFQGKKKTGGK